MKERKEMASRLVIPREVKRTTLLASSKFSTKKIWKTTIQEFSRKASWTSTGTKSFKPKTWCRCTKTCRLKTSSCGLSETMLSWFFRLVTSIRSRSYSEDTVSSTRATPKSLSKCFSECSTRTPAESTTWIPTSSTLTWLSASRGQKLFWSLKPSSAVLRKKCSSKAVFCRFCKP